MIPRFPALAVLAAAAFLALHTMPAEAAKVTTERIQLPAGQQGVTIHADEESAEPEDEESAAPDADGTRGKAAAKADIPIPEVHYGAGELPRPVMRLREQILEAARSGDVERLRPVLESNEMPPTLSLGQIDDPIDYLKEASGDAEGRELLAILSEVMEAGWVHVDVGTPQEMYIWPYFARYPLDKLSPPQEVELYRILTAGDVDEMRRFGAYIFYRVGIAPDGTWHYFVAGD